MRLPKLKVSKSFYLLLLFLTLKADGRAAGFHYFVEPGGVMITGYKGSSHILNIPSEIEGKPVTSIGDSAFARMPAIISVAIPNTVTNIGEFAFSGIGSPSHLSKISFGTNVTHIGTGAFLFCVQLSEVNIPASVASIGEAPFRGCFKLKRMTVDTNNSHYCSVDGVLFNKSKTALIQYPPGKEGPYVIPDTVNKLGEMAMWNCPELTSLKIPEGITNIGWEAFSACNRMTEIFIPKSVTYIDDAFGSCVSLSAAYFYGDAPVFHQRAFLNNRKLIVYRLETTQGWGFSYDERPVELWTTATKGKP